MIEKENRKVKEKRMRRIRKFGQAKVKHAKKGIYSCIFAGGIFLTMCLLVTITFQSRGTSGGLIGSFGLLCIIASGMGIYTGYGGFKEREKNYLTCKIGMIANGVFLFCFVLFFLRGLL